ncbi:MAG: MBL fold metallo-hydrolase [Desulfohalobiaceae bacterium]|nr:MBL fold metallo-hydrolase [Desulfohalobiaceae bacterium]
MVVQNPPARVTERIFQLGEKQSCIYLLQGGGEASKEPDCALLGGGMVTTGPEVIRQIRELGADPQRIGKLLILHSHFDHCSAAFYLRQQWPWLEILASERSGVLLQKPKVIEAIQSMNEVLLQRQGRQELAREPGFCFQGLQVDRSLRDGDRVDCGDLSLQVLQAPGHSSCSIVLFEPWQQALFSSDSAGIPMGEEVFTAANSDFDRYQESLLRMAQLEVSAVLPEHFGARVGPEARAFLEASLYSAHRTRRLLEETYRENPDVDSCSKEVVDQLMQRMPEDFLPGEVISMVVGQMVNYIARRHQEEA